MTVTFAFRIGIPTGSVMVPESLVTICPLAFVGFAGFAPQAASQTPRQTASDAPEIDRSMVASYGKRVDVASPQRSMITLPSSA
jgi:hypothetical protein